MRKEDCFYLGHISRKHGLKGEIIAFFDTDQKENYTNLESVLLLMQDELVPFFIDESAQNSKGHFILKFEDVNTLKEAESLIGRELYLPLSILPKLSGKAFYFHEVIGFKVIDALFGEVGICKTIQDHTAQPIFIVERNENEILIPAVDQFIKKIDRENKEILLNCPPGLIELYIDEEA